MYFEWTPVAGGTPIRFGDASTSSPYYLEAYDGVGNNFASAQVKKAPYQTGGTLVGITVQPRVISMTVMIIAVDGSSLDAHRQTLTKALGLSTTQLGQTPRLGKLQYSANNGLLVEIDAVPINSPQFSETGSPLAVRADIELLCPDPYWRSVNSTSFTVPYNSTTSVTIQGDAPTPVQITVPGSVTNPIFTNVSTGESLGINMTINSGSTLVIDTAFGKKSVKIGATSYLSKVDLARNRFWHLQAGVQSISVSRASGSGASPTFTYYARYYGV